MAERIEQLLLCGGILLLLLVEKALFLGLFQTVKRVYKGAEGTEALKEDLKLNDKDTYGLKSLKFRMLPDGMRQYGSKRHKRVLL